MHEIQIDLVSAEMQKRKKLDHIEESTVGKSIFMTTDCDDEKLKLVSSEKETLIRKKRRIKAEDKKQLIR